MGRRTDFPLRGLIVWFFLVAALAVLLFLRWPGPGWLATDFHQLLPATAQNPWEQKANHEATAAYERQLVLLAEGQGALDFLRQAVSRLEAEGYAEPAFEQRQSDAWEALTQVLQAHAPGLATAQDRALLAVDPDAYLAQFRRLLYSPLGGPYLNNLPDDPLGLFRHFVSANLGALQVGNSDAQLSVVQVPQAQLGFTAVAGLYTTYRELSAQAAERGMEFHALGAPLFTAYGVHSGREEMSTIGLVSLLVLVVLLWTSLRSGRGLLLTLLTVASGVAGGFAITLLVFQQLHLLALVFGSTLIGIAADYAFHSLSHSLLPGWKTEQGIRPVFRSLSLSAATSVLGFLSLLVLPFPGLQQMGCFMAAGLLAAFVTICLLFPALYRGPAATAVVPGVFQRAPLAGVLSARVWLPLVLVLSLSGIYQLEARDELRDFYAAPAELEMDQRAVETALGGARGSGFLLLRAANTEQLLQREEALVAQVPGLRGGISTLVPSEAAQRQLLQIQRELLHSGQLARWQMEMGIAAEQQASLLAEYQARLEGHYQPLRAEDLSGLQLPLGVGGFLGCEQGECASWIRLTGREDPARLSSLLADQTDRGERYLSRVEPVARINQVLRDYRQSTPLLFALVSIAVFLLLWRSLGWRAALYVLALPLSACLLAMGALGWLRGCFSIVHLLALLPVMGVGLDFAIFRRLTPFSARPAALLAVTLSACTSILAFGMLAFSETPVIADFGFTIGSGLLGAWLLCWLRRPTEADEPVSTGRTP